VLTNPTMNKLVALSLTGMAAAFKEQLERADYGALAFEDRLGLLVDREATEREDRRLARNLKAAKLRTNASIEDLDLRAPRGLDRGVVLSLADAQWVRAHQNVLVIGPTGVGKTYLACALAQAALRRGHTALYLRAPRMLTDLAIARADGRLPKVFAAWARIDVLVIDDLALQPLTAAQAAELLEVVEDRAQRRSTIVTSQLPVAQWHGSLGEATIADAILDRLVHNAHRLELRGDSLRRPQKPGALTAGTAAEGSDGPDRPQTAVRAGKRPATTARDARE
jgi:DNA replication protein DnaC